MERSTERHFAGEMHAIAVTEALQQQRPLSDAQHRWSIVKPAVGRPCPQCNGSGFRNYAVFGCTGDNARGPCATCATVPA